MKVDLEFITAPWAEPLLEPARYKGASGGRSSGKSHFFAERAVRRMAPNPNLRVVCIREVQRSLKFSAKSLVESKIVQFGLEPYFNVLTTEIRHRYGKGIMIFEGMQDHTADSIKSLEGFSIAWVEEAQSISKRSLDLLLPTIRMPDSEIWFSWNPDQPTDPVDMMFSAMQKEDGASVHTTYKDNPFCPDVMKKEAARLLANDPESYEHIWGGGYFLGGGGRVYSNFKNKPFPDGNIDEGVTDTGAEILVGMDFNVNPMSAVICVRAADECHVLDAIELMSSNTEEMASELRRRHPNRRIIVYPDPSGKARKTSAPVGQTDFTILENAGFEVRAPNAAPPVVDRVNNSQAMYLTEGRRKVRISPNARPLITALANLVYKEGTSIRDKGSGFDHLPDALDYLLWEEFNVLARHTLSVGTFKI